MRNAIVESPRQDRPLDENVCQPLSGSNILYMIPLHECKESVSFLKAVQSVEHCAIVRPIRAPLPTLNSVAL